MKINLELETRHKMQPPRRMKGIQFDYRYGKGCYVVSSSLELFDRVMQLRGQLYGIVALPINGSGRRIRVLQVYDRLPLSPPHVALGRSELSDLERLEEACVQVWEFIASFASLDLSDR